MGQVQFVTDEAGRRTAALVPIAEWEDLQSKVESLTETVYLLSSDAMRKRLLDARQSNDTVTLEKVRETLGL